MHMAASLQKPPLMPQIGAFLCFFTARYLQPPPTALLAYYGTGSLKHEFLQQFVTTVASSMPKVPRENVRHLLDAPVTSGECSVSNSFDPNCLVAGDLTPNAEWKEPSDTGPEPRLALGAWLIQENLFPDLLGAVDVGFDDPSWRTYPPTVIIHPDQDMEVPYFLGLSTHQAIGTIFCLTQSSDL